ncbi:MAG: FadR/GntR family transcriptional regulator [Blautia sp.]
MGNLFTATKRESAVDIVINRVKQLLTDRLLLPGDKLPSELEIAEGLGVSRGSVREAMKILSAFGLVDIRVGNGTYVSKSPGSGLMDSLLFSFFIANPDIESLYEFRQIFEVNVLELILDHHQENYQVRRKLQDNLDQLQEFLDSGASQDQILKNDIAFHRLLGEASCNPMVEQIYNFIMDSLRASIANTHKNQRGEYVQQTHKKIHQIICDQNYDAIKPCIKESMDIWYDLQDISH